MHLLHAAECGDLYKLNEAIASGVDLNIKDKNGNTALMLAVIAGNLDCTECLLAAGADANAHDFEGYSVLMLAALFGRDDSIIPLVNFGASVNLKNPYGCTAMDIAKSISGCIQLSLGRAKCLELLDQFSTPILHA